MSRFRSSRIPLTAIWLSVYVLMVPGTAIVAFTSGSALPDIVCTCAHGADHGSCPMHRTPARSNGCGVQGTQDDLASAMFSLLGPLVPPVTSDVAVVDAPSPRLIAYVSPSSPDWLVPPEPPPPRR